MRKPILVRRVTGQSMLPALRPGSIAVGWTYYRKLRPGQIIVFRHDRKDKIKRISKVSENGATLQVLGDNPSGSTDSRHFGPIDIQTVKAIIVWPAGR